MAAYPQRTRHPVTTEAEQAATKPATPPLGDPHPHPTARTNASDSPHPPRAPAETPSTRVTVQPTSSLAPSASTTRHPPTARTGQPPPKLPAQPNKPPTHTPQPAQANRRRRGRPWKGFITTTVARPPGGSAATSSNASQQPIPPPPPTDPLPTTDDARPIAAPIAEPARDQQPQLHLTTHRPAPHHRRRPADCDPSRRVGGDRLVCFGWLGDVMW